VRCGKSEGKRLGNKTTLTELSSLISMHNRIISLAKLSRKYSIPLLYDTLSIMVM